jgi:hypothetical protein
VMEDGGTSSRYPSVFYFSIIISNETTHLIGCRVKGERIRLDHILEGKFKPNSFNATYIGKFLMPFSICILYRVYTVPVVYMVLYVVVLRNQQKSERYRT